MPVARMSSAMSDPSSGAEQRAAQSAPSSVVVSVTVRGPARLVWVALGVAAAVGEVPRDGLGGGGAEVERGA